MTQKDKELLLKDLCSRLPYNTICQVEFKNCGKYETKNMTLSGIFKDEAYFTIENGSVYSNNYKPYLFPISSMSEEEAVKYITLTHYNTDNNGKPYRELTVEALDWLLLNHFDFRELIPMGLSIDATGLNIY